ncbi:MAG: response regulator transcription factor [Chitinophagaceae bacterium]|nr:response regulator transcription factor [Chitinophagaceae bacterium]
MIRAIAIDDEPPALKVIESFCAKLDYIELEKTFSKPSDALKYIEKYPVDLMFLDIQMPSVNGIDFYKNLGKDIMVIFTTAFGEYAVEGFNLNAVDYLLKPFDFKRFEKAAVRAQEYFNFLTKSDLGKQNYFFIRADYSLIKVMIDDILYIEGLSDYIKIHFDNQKPLVARQRMKNILERLPETEFVRIHKSYIVPVGKIAFLRNRMVHLKKGETTIELPTGKNYEEELMRRVK